MGSVWAAGFLLRRLRAEVGVVALLIALVALTSFLFAGAPRLFNLVADAALVDQLRAAPVTDRNIQLSSTSTAPGTADPLAVIDETGAQYRQAFPESIEPLIGDRSFSITSTRFVIPEPPRYRTYVSLRYQDGLEGAIRLVAGRMPASNGESLPIATLGFGDEPPPLPATPPRIEIAISEATAAEIGADIGTTLGATLDGADPILRSFVIRRIDAEFKVVGIFAVVDPAADIWFADRHLQRPDIGGSEEFPIAYATGLIAPEAFADLATSGLPFQMAWRYYLAPERVDVGQLETVVPELQRLQSVSADESFGGSFGEGGLALRTGLLGIIGRYLAERSASEAVLSVAAIGPFSLAVGAIAMVAILLVVRRRASLELARGRGASGLLILAAQLWEATLLAGGAALIGLLLAIAIVPGRSSNLSTWLALATGAAATLAMVIATWPTVRRRLGGAGRDDAAVLPTSPRRLVLELTGVGLAVAGVLLLQQRGLVIGTGRVDEIVRLDPFLAAVPVLAGIAMGLIAMRLYPLPIRAFSWLAARRRDLVPVLGLRSVGRHSAAANLPLLVLMLTAAFGAFASVILATIDRGQVEAAWADVGADYRIELNGSAEGAIDPSQVDGVGAVAAAYLDQAATFADSPSQRSQVVLDAVDAQAYADVVAGSPIAFSWPSGFTALDDTAQPGTPEAPIPAIVSRRLPSGSGPLAQGDPFTVVVGIHKLSFVVVDRRASFPGVRADAAFVIASLETLQRAQAEAPLVPSVLFVSGPPDIEEALTAVASDNSSSLVASRYSRYAALRAAPLIAMVTGGFRIALLVAVFYAGFAIVAALTLTAARRSQDLAFLRTLGLSARQALGLTVLEQGPPVVLALIPGVALGIWIAFLLAAGLGISAFIGAQGVLAIEVSWGEIAVVGAALVIMVTIAGGASTWLARRTRAIDALRLGGD